ncbi:MAG: hypothetical protein ACKO9V_11170 [Candidatus Kapaibacterium sp.]
MRMFVEEVVMPLAIYILFPSAPPRPPALPSLTVSRRLSTTASWAKMSVENADVQFRRKRLSLLGVSASNPAG